MNDKLMHLVAGFLISLAGGLLTGNILIGFTLAFAAGAAKEIWDYFGHGTSDLRDLIVTVEGGAIGSVVVAVLEWTEVL